MVTYKWYRGEVPRDLPIKQVYGIVFSREGKVILRVEEDKYKLTGGKPEKVDKDLEATLKREYLEELNIEIEDIHYLGYLLVEEKQDRYAQVRMVARIKSVGCLKPDIDNEKIYKRFLSNPENVKKYLNYSDSAGNQMIEDAVVFANHLYRFPENKKEEYFIE